MSSAPSPDSAATVRSAQLSLLVRSIRYDVLDTLSHGPRADVLVGVPAGARSLEQLVAIKRFHPDPACVDWVALIAELELASQLQHENLPRTLAVGLESRHYFLVSEFLEGATLRACLDGAAATHTRLPQAAVARILLAIVDAVQHASTRASSALSRQLVHGPIAADDVFITFDGQVKLLGFKSSHARTGAGTPGAGSLGTAIDALLGRHWTAELGSVLARARGHGADPAGQIREALRLQGQDPDAQGRAELASLLRHVLRRAQARQALRLAKAYAQLRGPLRRADALTEPEAVPPPKSGYRRIGARDSARSAPLGEPNVAQHAASARRRER